MILVEFGPNNSPLKKILLSKAIGTLNIDKTTAHSISVTFEHSLRCLLVSIFTLKNVHR